MTRQTLPFVPAMGLRAAVIAATVGAFVASAAAQDSVNVPRSTAPVAAAPPETRACTVSFDGLTEVGNTCPVRCYGEAWDGPVLTVQNACNRTIWIAYEYLATDGKQYRSACYQLDPRTTYAIPDTTIVPEGHRVVVICQKPGPGYLASGFTLTCADEHQPLPPPPPAPHGTPTSRAGR